MLNVLLTKIRCH